jgi:alpha-tubulin suppressor-like RCC1 family protein
VEGVSGARLIAAGLDHACAVTERGVLCWGSNFYGQLGPSVPRSVFRTTAVLVLESNNVVALDSSGTHSCATAGGSTRCWGTTVPTPVPDQSIDPRPLVELPGLPGVIGLSGYCALLGSGLVRCWGPNTLGQLGIGTFSTDNAPVTVDPVTVHGVSGATALAHDRSHGCAIVQGGRVLCWGLNGGGQLGDGSLINANLPVAVRRRL